jgi:hypothetical protein
MYACAQYAPNSLFLTAITTAVIPVIYNPVAYTYGTKLDVLLHILSTYVMPMRRNMFLHSHWCIHWACLGLSLVSCICRFTHQIWHN